MITVYYLVQEILGPNNEYGVKAPNEGGLGVAALNMLRAAQHPLFNEISFRVVLPGTRNILEYFKIDDGTLSRENGKILRIQMPFSGEPVHIILDRRLGDVNSYAEQVREPNGFFLSEIVSEILNKNLKDADIIHLNGWHFYTVARDLKVLGRPNPVILNVHVIRDVYRHIKKEQEINPWAEVIENSDLLVPVSVTYARQIAEGKNEPLSDSLIDQISQKDICGINNGLDLEYIDAKIEQKSNEIAWIHRIDSRQKGLKLLQSIVERLVEGNGTWKINILGNAEASDKEAQSFVDRLEELQSAYPDLVHFDSDYTPEKKNKILRRSKIFLCTSLFEGSPYSVMEAMNYGLISVVTPKAGLLDLVSNGQNGFVSRDMNLKSFWASLEDAFKACDSSGYPDMIHKAQHSVPTAKDMFGEYKNLYAAYAVRHLEVFTRVLEAGALAEINTSESLILRD